MKSKTLQTMGAINLTFGSVIGLVGFVLDNSPLTFFAGACITYGIIYGFMEVKTKTKEETKEKI